jgi:hypothetical protein
MMQTGNRSRNPSLFLLPLLLIVMYVSRASAAHSPSAIAAEKFISARTSRSRACRCSPRHHQHHQPTQLHISAIISLQSQPPHLIHHARLQPLLRSAIKRAFAAVHVVLHLPPRRPQPLVSFLRRKQLQVRGGSSPAPLAPLPRADAARSVTLTNCAVGFTYFIRCIRRVTVPLHVSSHASSSDWSSLSPATAADTLPHARAAPFLLSLSAIGATVTQTPHGYTLCPSLSSITLSYSTQTCDEFYRLRSSAWPQDCDARMLLLSSVVTGTTPMRARACARVRTVHLATQVYRWTPLPQTRPAVTAGARCDVFFGGGG